MRRVRPSPVMGIPSPTRVSCQSPPRARPELPQPGAAGEDGRDAHPAAYHGTWYHVDGAYCEPRPDPPIPIMVGTNGPKALGVVARLADGWNWDAPWETVYRPPTRSSVSTARRSVGRSPRSSSPAV